MNQHPRPYQHQTQYGYPLPKAFQKQNVYNDTGVGRGSMEQAPPKSNQGPHPTESASCGPFGCPKKSGAYEKYPCAFKNFH